MAWKAQQSKVKQNRKIKLSAAALGILIVIIVLGNFINFFFSLTRPISPKIGIENSYDLWDKKTNFNLLTASFDKSGLSKINLYTLSPNENQIVALSLSNEIYLNVPLEFGSWTLGSVYKLGQEQNPKIGAKLLRLSVSNLLGIPVDAVIISEGNQDFDSPDSFVAKLRKDPLAPLTLTQNIETNLSRLQSISLFKILSKVRQDKLIALDLSQSSITESKLLPDSSRVLGVDAIKLDYFIREKMADSQIIDEGASIAVFNGTSHPGLANEVSRVITNLGGNVISVSSTEEKFEKSLVITTEDLDSETSKRISQIFAPLCIKQKCQSKDPKVTYSRAKINIVLGEDYYKIWNER